MSYIPSITLPAFVFNSPAISILLPVGAGLSTGYMTGENARRRQRALKKPALQPPDVVFGPAWTILYGLMGYSAYRAWSVGLSSLDPVKLEDARRGATLYTVQLALNLAFVPLFFVLRKGVIATVDIVALTGTAAYLTYVWGKVDSIASYCLVPYVGWLSFATYLSVATCRLNGWDLGGPSGTREQGKGNSKAQ